MKTSLMTITKRCLKKVQGEEIRVTTNRDGQNRHPTKFGYRNQEKKIVPREKRKILK